jgi:hypothetical protein
MAGAYGGVGNNLMLSQLINPQGYTASQIANANAMNVPTSSQALGPEFNQFKT